MQTVSPDLHDLLAPIPGSDAAGELLRYDGAYDRIREARREEDPGLEQGVWKTSLKRADWIEVERLCIDVLRNRSKDLQIAAWLLEAWLNLHGFAGVRDGLGLLLALCENYWDEVHPRIEDGDIEFRIAPFEWMNERLVTELKLLPVTAPESEDVTTYSWADWESACLAEIQERKFRGAPADDKRITQARFQRSATLTAGEFYIELAEDLAGARHALAALEALLDAKLEKHSPSLRQFQAVLESIYAMAAGVLNQRQISAQPGGDWEEDERAEAAEPEAGHSFEGNPIRSRAEAYRRLAEAAEYLLRTEPHSPTPYLVNRAISWGGMKLDEILAELVRSDSELSEIFRLLQLGSVKKQDRK
jgi:type VI secretion system protein ImpA